MCTHPEPPADPTGVYLCLPVAGSRPALFHCIFSAPSLFTLDELILLVSIMSLVIYNCEMCDFLMENE